MKEFNLDKNKSDKKIFSNMKEKKDQDAFIEMYDLLVEPIFRFVYFKIGNQDDAQDLSSAIFLKAWNYILENKIKNTKTLKALIYKIARNSIIDYYRKASNNVNLISLDQEDRNNNSSRIDIPDQKQNIHKNLEVKNDYEQLLEKMHKLKDEYREVIILRYIEEYSITEIAEILNKSKTNIRVLTHRALKALKDL